MWPSVPPHYYPYGAGLGQVQSHDNRYSDGHNQSRDQNEYANRTDQTKQPGFQQPHHAPFFLNTTDYAAYHAVDDHCADHTQPYPHPANLQYQQYRHFPPTGGSDGACKPYQDVPPRQVFPPTGYQQHSHPYPQRQSQSKARPRSRSRTQPQPQPQTNRTQQYPYTNVVTSTRSQSHTPSGSPVTTGKALPPLTESQNIRHHIQSHRSRVQTFMQQIFGVGIDTRQAYSSGFTARLPIRFNERRVQSPVRHRRSERMNDGNLGRSSTHSRT